MRSNVNPDNVLVGANYSIAFFIGSHGPTETEINNKIAQEAKWMQNLEKDDGIYLFTFDKNSDAVSYLWLRNPDEKVIRKEAKEMTQDILVGSNAVYAVKPYEGLAEAFSEAHYKGWYYGKDSTIGMRFMHECSEHGSKII